MTHLKIEDIIPDKSRLRVLVDSLSGLDFYNSFMKEIYDELGLIEIHNLDEQLMIIKESGVIKNTNNGNSYVSYLIGVTTVPPNGPLMKKGGSLPDVDLDFNARRRNEVFAHLYTKYKDGFAHIGTHGTLQAKNAFKDVCRIFNVPFLDANSLSSLIPDTAESITEAMLDEKFAKRVNADPVLQDVIKYSKALEGTVKSYGVHACVAHNTKIRTDTGIKTISEVYNMTNGEGENLPPTLPVCTTYGLMHSRIVKTGKKKGYSVSLFSGDDNREISNAIVSADHKIWAGREGYLKYSSMKAGTKYYYTAKTYSPWFVTDLFIAGFLLVMISKNVFENNYTMTRDSFGFKLEDMWEIFRDLYVDGYASFDRAWGKTHRVSSPSQLAKKVYGLTKLENISYSIVKSYGVDELFYKNLFEQQDFIHGMFSTLQAYRDVSISTPTTISSSNVNDLSSQDFSVSNQSGYSSPQILNIGGIKEYLNDHLRQFDIHLGNIFFLDDVNFCRYIAYNPIFSGWVRPPDVYVMKMGLYSSTPLDMYDVQVITFDDSRQNFIANGIHVHNCGVILSPVPLNETVPLYAQDGLPVTMYDGPTMEKLNFIKVDLLGVKVLAIIDETLRFINGSSRNYEKIDSIYSLRLDDSKTYEMLATGDVLGSFQLEGGSIAPYVPKCMPKTIDDISAILATIRPGPLGLGYDKLLIQAMSNSEHFEFRFPKYTHIFKDTYGLGLYQEQYMILLSEMCGFDPIKTDVWRKAVGKKDAALLATLKEDFINGAVANGESKKELEEFWEEMTEFGRYAFNKSHKELKT